MKLDKRACRHAANVPLHISLNAGVLYTERVKYLVTAAVKLLGGHRVLAVYFYECERLKANDRMPKWVVFQGKDTFATLERDAEGNVKWRDAMVQHLTDYYMGDFLQSCVFYKKAGCHTIARYIGAKSDPTKVLWELNWYQQDIRDQQTKIRRYKRDTVVLNKMSSVPQTPANLKRWADKHIMPHYLFYDYNNGRVKTQVYCTYCEKFSVIKRPKNNDVLRCPKCDQKVIAKAQGRRAAYYEDRETCQVVQQISPHKELQIVCPQRANDLVDEGKALHHCVGGYIDNVAEGRCLIVFVRRVEEPKKPYVTVEVRDGKIAQIPVSYTHLVKSHYRSV